MKYVKRGEIYYADLPEGKYSEQLGNRPVVILQNNTGNKYSPTVIVAAITRASKKNIPTHLNIDLKDPSTILLEQIFTISKDRLKMKIGSIPEDKLNDLDNKLKISLGMNY